MLCPVYTGHFQIKFDQNIKEMVKLCTARPTFFDQMTIFYVFKSYPY